MKTRVGSQTLVFLIHFHICCCPPFRSNVACVAVDIGFSKSDVLSTLPTWTIALLIPTAVPVKVGLFNGALLAIEFMTVEEKSASSPNACANSFKVLSASGALFTRLLILASTSSLVYVFALFAFRSRAACVAYWLIRVGGAVYITQVDHFLSYPTCIATECWTD